jgi:hypothetical protein
MNAAIVATAEAITRYVRKRPRALPRNLQCVWPVYWSTCDVAGICDDRVITHKSQVTMAELLTLFRSANVPLLLRIARYLGAEKVTCFFGNHNSQIATLVERQTR